MITERVVTVPRASLRYWVLAFFYEREERFPKTSCGVRASVILQPIGYLTSCLLLIALGIVLFLVAGITWGMARTPIMSLGLGVLNLLLFVFAVVWPRLWWCYIGLGGITTALALSIDVALFTSREGFLQDLLLPPKASLIAFGTALGIGVVALLTIKWWLPLFNYLYRALCKSVRYT